MCQEENRERERQSFSLFSQQASVGLNLIVTLLTAVACGYYLGRAWFGVESGKVCVTVCLCMPLGHHALLLCLLCQLM
jgi:hypothetical protein